jgi:Bacterial protein of unknown function (DUF899)
MTDHEVVSHEEWAAAREELLVREKEHTRQGDELARRRRELPWVRVEKEYRFDTDEGTRTLAELFDGRSQLLVYHFMFGPGYQAGCTTCSSMVDTFDGAVVHLHARDVTFVLVSQAPLEKLQGYKRRMGWNMPWVSAAAGEFNFDLGYSRTEEQTREASAPMLEAGAPPIVASLVHILVETRGRTLRIAVRDDGVGGADPARGTGLLGLRARAQAVGGTVSLDSQPAAGTLLNAELPLGTNHDT